LLSSFAVSKVASPLPHACGRSVPTVMEDLIGAVSSLSGSGGKTGNADVPHRPHTAVQTALIVGRQQAMGVLNVEWSPSPSAAIGDAGLALTARSNRRAPRPLAEHLAIESPFGTPTKGGWDHLTTRHRDLTDQLSTDGGGEQFDVGDTDRESV